MEKLAKLNADEKRHETDCETVVLETDSELGVQKSIVVKCRQRLFCSTPKHNNSMEFYGNSTTELTDITREFHSNTSDILRSISARNATLYRTAKAAKRKGTYLTGSKPKRYVTNTVRRKLTTVNDGNVASLVKKFRRLEAMLKVTLTHEARRRKCEHSVDLGKLQGRYDGNRANSLDDKSKYNEKSILVDNEKCINGAIDVNRISVEDYKLQILNNVMGKA